MLSPKRLAAYSGKASKRRPVSATNAPAMGPSARAKPCSTTNGSASESCSNVVAMAESPSTFTSSCQREGCASSAGRRNGETVSVSSGGFELSRRRPSSSIVQVTLARPTLKRTVRPACSASLSRAQRSRSSARLTTKAPGSTRFSRSESVAAVQRDDARGKIEPFDAPETSLLHHRLQSRLIRVHPNRLGEIAVTRFVAGDEPSQARQNVEAVPVVGRPQRLPDAAELEDQRDTSGLEHASHLGQRDLFARHVAQAEADANAVEGARWER